MPWPEWIVPSERLSQASYEGGREGYLWACIQCAISLLVALLSSSNHLNTCEIPPRYHTSRAVSFRSRCSENQSALISHPIKEQPALLAVSASSSLMAASCSVYEPISWVLSCLLPFVLDCERMPDQTSMNRSIHSRSAPHTGSEGPDPSSPSHNLSTSNQLADQMYTVGGLVCDRSK